jgi:hypothetical protein
MPDFIPLEVYLWGCMKDLLYQEKSETRDEVLRRIIDGTDLVQNNHESVRKATRSVLHRACLCMASARGHFEQQAAKVRTLCPNIR